VIVLNGGSSSGKTSIARCLQRLLGPTWITLGADDLVRAQPGGDEVDDLIRAQQDGDGPVGTEGSIVFGPDGSVIVRDDFRRAEACWYAGVAAVEGMARLQAGRVHEGVVYDLIVDTTAASTADYAGTIASHLSRSGTGPWPVARGQPG
jgi:chloramphenicol 3-O-phosphotransferase